MPVMTDEAWEQLSSYLQTLLVSDKNKIRLLFEALPLQYAQSFRDGIIIVNDEYIVNKIERISANAQRSYQKIADEELFVTMENADGSVTVSTGEILIEAPIIEPVEEPVIEEPIEEQIEEPPDDKLVDEEPIIEGDALIEPDVP